MAKKQKKQISFDDFRRIVVKHIKFLIEKLEQQDKKIKELESKIENMQIEIDTLKAKLSGRRIEKPVPETKPIPEPMGIESIPEPAISEPTSPPPEQTSAPTLDEIDNLLPEIPEAPIVEDLAPTPAEQSAEPNPLESGRPEPVPSKVPEIPEPSIPEPTPISPAASEPAPPPAEPASSSEDVVGELDDLDKYLDKLDQIVESVGMEDTLGSGGEDVVPEVTPEGGSEGSTVSPEELRKKKKDLLKALTELEIA